LQILRPRACARHSVMKSRGIMLRLPPRHSHRAAIEQTKTTIPRKPCQRETSCSRAQRRSGR
jgi:hypothetical protein